MQYALGIEKAVGEIDADSELFDELGAAELAQRLDDCLIVIVSAGEDVALHTGRDLLVNLVVVDLSETGTSPLQIGRAHVLTPVTNAQFLCPLLLEKKNNNQYKPT